MDAREQGVHHPEPKPFVKRPRSPLSIDVWLGGDDITLLNRLLDLDLRVVERLGELRVEGAQAGEVPDAFGIAVDDDIASCRTGDPTPKTTGTTRTSQSTPNGGVPWYVPAPPPSRVLPGGSAPPIAPRQDPGPRASTGTEGRVAGRG